MISKFLKHLLKKVGYKFIKEDYFNRNFLHVNDQNNRVSKGFATLDQLFDLYLKDNFNFIQIGANNGRRDDPIHHLIVQHHDKISGIAIEPVQEYFDELLITYKKFPNVKLLKRAIHTCESEMTIYKIDPQLTEIEDYFRGMASFDKSNFSKDGVLSENIVTETVQCISFMELIEKEKINKLHLLQIDAEGYDLEIIKSIDFNRIKPRIINFEHRWDSGHVTEEEMFSVVKLLLNNKYQIVISRNDALAYL